MEAVTVKNLSFRYPESDVDVLNNVSFTVNEGEFVTLCGLSGSGKSTLLRQLKPSLAPHGTKQGSILFYGNKIESLSLREQSEKIGYVLQSPENQIVTDKVWHELSFGLESLGMKQNDIRRRVAETASFFGIQSYFEANVSELSGGQKQILNLAAVMAMQPQLLILDEPTSQLDPIAASEFIACLTKINRELGTTIIITEHRLEEVLPVSNRVIVLEKGAVISDDTPVNTGLNLKKAGSDCFLSLPAPMKIWHGVSNEEQKCPVTISQGREWLRRYSQTHPLSALYPERQFNHTDTVLSLKNIWFRYEKDTPDIIKNLSLDVKAGEFLSILGGNGTGKSTLLSLMNGTGKPYRGRVISDNRLCLTLPQNPQTILNGKTVYETLTEVLEGTDIPLSERQNKLTETAGVCGIGNLMKRHPFDLSGGEMQKVALAKLLLLQPKILLLDEPTKGLDAHFKTVFAKIISHLTDNGASVIMVSHDVEFCAKYSHKCVFMFNGELVAEGTPREFFSNNSFYVTSSARMSKDIIEGAVTPEDVIYCCTGKISDDSGSVSTDSKLDFADSEKSNAKEKLPLWKKLLGITGAVFLLFGILENLGKLPFFSPQQMTLWQNFLFIAAPVLMLMVSLSSVSKKPTDTPFEKNKLSKRTVAAAVMILLFIPLTIYVGNVYLYNQKFLFISLLVMLECMLPFFLVFEGRKPQARELVLIAVLCAIAVAGRSAFSALPQVKPVLAIVIISAVALGGETGFITGAVTMLVSNVYMGQGAWTPWQMFAAGIIGFLSGVLFRKGLLSRNRGALCVYGFIVTILIYGGIMNFSSLVLSHAAMNRETILAFYVQGLPYDIIHASSTAVFLFFFAEPMLDKLDRVKTKYGLIS